VKVRFSLNELRPFSVNFADAVHFDVVEESLLYIVELALPAFFLQGKDLFPFVQNVARRNAILKDDALFFVQVISVVPVCVRVLGR
jgi:hypothetical protein